MAKANKKVTNPSKTNMMNKDFDTIVTQLSDIATATGEIMPLFSAALELAIKILRMYKKAFNVGENYGK